MSNNRTQVGHAMNSHGFVWAYRHTATGSEQIGSISSSVSDESLKEFHDQMCKELGEGVYKFCGSYWKD